MGFCGINLRISERAQATNLSMSLKLYFEFATTFPRGQWVGVHETSLVVNSLDFSRDIVVILKL